MNLPSYPHSRPLLLEDKPLLDRLFVELQPWVSELTFANLYLFRRAHGYTLTRLGETTLIGGQ
ncbi:MAG TPA: hypothetical protein VFR01_08445, partial [Geobacterales bacterium]|nr:hypothetical protein [Geobacterales bacterium]